MPPTRLSRCYRAACVCVGVCVCVCYVMYVCMYVSVQIPEYRSPFSQSFLTFKFSNMNQREPGILVPLCSHTQIHIRVPTFTNGYVCQIKYQCILLFAKNDFYIPTQKNVFAYHVTLWDLKLK